MKTCKILGCFVDITIHWFFYKFVGLAVRPFTLVKMLSREQINSSATRPISIKLSMFTTRVAEVSLTEFILM